MKHYPPSGTRVRLLVRTMFGWKGTGTMLADQRIAKDGTPADWRDLVDACPWELAKCRDQTPNPDHAEALRLSEG